MYFPLMYRYAPKRNLLPTQPRQDDVARREVARLSAQVEQLQQDLKVQFTRIAQLQADVDQIKKLLTSKGRLEGNCVTGSDGEVRPSRARRKHAVQLRESVDVTFAAVHDDHDTLGHAATAAPVSHVQTAVGLHSHGHRRSPTVPRTMGHLHLPEAWSV
jgi:hypothetical protein